ncbi:hypothetical protein URH17368_1241 [Alicyclobacillus hesperidum URH17-3-68]|nr:hypothetical protein URH17368_1241 [Alicyclobacillus hesperidum URH17-3-68]
MYGFSSATSTSTIRKTMAQTSVASFPIWLSESAVALMYRKLDLFPQFRLAKLDLHQEHDDT